MQKKLMTLAGATTLMVSGHAFAVSPVSFGGYTISGGNIAYSCPAGAVCSAPVSGAGFYQQEVLVGGSRYFHTIIDDGTGFKDENWVRAGMNGLAEKQSISGNQALGSDTVAFTSTATLSMGWAGSASTPALQLAQTLSQYATAATANVVFTTDFSFRQNQDANGAVTGKAIDVTQMTSTGAFTTDVEQFAHHVREGNLNPVTAATTVALGGSNITVSPSNLVNGTWIGQSTTNSSGTGSVSQFAYQSFNNVTTTASATDVNFNSMTPTAGAGWAAVFGTNF